VAKDLIAILALLNGGLIVSGAAVWPSWNTSTVDGVGSNIIFNTDDDGVSGTFVENDVYRFARTKTILDPLWLCRCTVSLDGDVRTRKPYLHGDYTVRTHIIVHHRMQCTIFCISSCSLRSKDLP
jgi:hypothetical protein